MQPGFEREIEAQKYIAALVAMFSDFLHQRPRQNGGDGRSIPRAIDGSTSPDLQNIYQDSDPPTPHWGC